MRFLFPITVLIFCHYLFSCNNLYERKFDKNQWLECDEIEFTPRDEMYKDLIKNYQLKGLTYQKLIHLLGKPVTNIKDSTGKIYYPVLVKYGTIDPIQTIYLEFSINKDSVIKDFKVNEWEKNRD
jgi:hypothetical protein